MGHYREASWSGGQLDRQQLRQVLSRVLPVLASPQGRPVLDSLFSLFDTDQNGSVDWRELTVGLASLCSGSTHDRLRVIFDMFDTSHNGHISRAELAHLVRVVSGRPQDWAYAEQQSDRIMRALDKNRDGSLSFHEFDRWSGKHELVGWLDRFTQQYGQRFSQLWPSGGVSGWVYGGGHSIEAANHHFENMQMCTT